MRFVPAPAIFAPMALSIVARSTICGSQAALKMTVRPRARTDAMRMFSVAVTDASSRRIFAPLSSPLKRSVFLPATVFAPSERKPAKCVSRRRWPIWSPPGGGSDARPTRARSGPAKRKLVRIFAASAESIFAVLTLGVAIVTVPAFRSRATFAPKDFAASSIAATSAMSGTLRSVTVSEVKSEAAIIGRAAFLFPETRCVPEILLPPWMTKRLTTARLSCASRRTRRACRPARACRSAAV